MSISTQVNSSIGIDTHSSDTLSGFAKKSCNFANMIWFQDSFLSRFLAHILQKLFPRSTTKEKVYWWIPPLGHIGAKSKKYWCIPRTGIYHYIRNVDEPFLLANQSKDLLWKTFGGIFASNFENANFYWGCVIVHF